jgi:hypothetical protein
MSILVSVPLFYLIQESNSLFFGTDEPVKSPFVLLCQCAIILHHGNSMFFGSDVRSLFDVMFTLAAAFKQRMDTTRQRQPPV